MMGAMFIPIPHAGVPPAPQEMKMAQVVILSEAKDLVVEALGY